jgi:hypothetical protein
VQHHEVVHDAQVADRRDGNADGPQLRRVRLALIAQDVGFAHDHQGSRQAGEVVGGGAQR